MGTYVPTSPLLIHLSFQITILTYVIPRLSFLFKQMPFSYLPMLLLFHSNVLMTPFLMYFLKQSVVQEPLAQFSFRYTGLYILG